MDRVAQRLGMWRALSREGVVLLIGGVAAVLLGANAGAQALQLTVHDAQSGKPVPGVRVLAKTGSDVFPLAPTGGSGRTALPGELAAQSIRLSLSAPGYVPVEAAPVDELAEALSFPLLLQKGITVGGRVLDDTGQPAAGAQVAAECTPVEAVQGPWRVLLLGNEAPIETGGGGEWRLGAVPAELERITLRVVAPPHRTVSTFGFRRGSEPGIAALEDKTAHVVVPALHLVEGRVAGPENNPVSGARLAAWSLEQGPESYIEYFAQADGTFTITDLRNGTVVIAAQSPDFAPVLVRKDIPSEAPLDIALPPGNRLVVQVSDPSGSPIEGAVVELLRWRELEVLEGSWQTDAGGRLVWGGAPPEEVVVSIGAPGFQFREESVLTAGPSEHAIVLKRRETVFVYGTVTDVETGEDVPWCSATPGAVAWSGAEPEWLQDLAFEDGPGQFAVQLDRSDLPEGKRAGFRVRIEAEGYWPAETPVFTFNAGEQTHDVALRPLDGQY